MTDELPAPTGEKFTPELMEQWAVFQARHRAYLSKCNMASPNGHPTAWAHVEAFAHELISLADEKYLTALGQSTHEYEDLIDNGKNPGPAIKKLYDLALLEMRRQQRLGREAPPHENRESVLRLTVQELEEVNESSAPTPESPLTSET